MRISDWSSDVCSSDLLNLITVMWARRQDGRQALPCQATTLPKAALAGWRKNKIAEGVRILTVRAKFMAAARVLAAVIRARILTTIRRSEEHTSELQSLMRISYAVFCLKKKKKI